MKAINKHTMRGIAASVLLAAPMLALAQFGGTDPFTGTATGSLSEGIRTIVNAFLTIIAIIAVVFLIIGGVRYIVSQGDEDQASQAKNTILYAIIGLVVIGLSAVIVNFVISAST